MGTLRYNTWQNPDGTENYKCRAWVNFNGTGTVAIRASGNVSSITDNGTGDYTVNFTNAMPDTNYSVAGSVGQVQAYFFQVAASLTAPTTSAVRVRASNDAYMLFDSSFMYVSIFR